MFGWICRFIDIGIRMVFFPKRPADLAHLSDALLKRDVINTTDSKKASAAELELETRAWMRDFWSRSIVAWIALLISCSALTLSIRSCDVETKLKASTNKTSNSAAK